MSENGTQRMSTLEKSVPEQTEAPPVEPATEYQQVQAGRPDKGGGRFWSQRRIPALLAGLVLFAVAALFLYDLAMVRAGQDGGGWRRSLADELAERRLGDAAVVVGAVLAALLGLWLLVLALTPGLRSVLTMRGEPGTRVGMERNAAALVLRDRMMEVPGVRSAEVKVRRSRVRARAVSHFRDPETVRAEADSAIWDGVRQLGLAKQPKLDAQVTRPAKQ